RGRPFGRVLPHRPGDQCPAFGAERGRHPTDAVGAWAFADPAGTGPAPRGRVPPSTPGGPVGSRPGVECTASVPAVSAVGGCGRWSGPPGLFHGGLAAGADPRRQWPRGPAGRPGRLVPVRAGPLTVDIPAHGARVRPGEAAHLRGVPPAA